MLHGELSSRVCHEHGPENLGSASASPLNHRNRLRRTCQRDGLRVVR